MSQVQSWIINVGFSETLKDFRQHEGVTNLGALLDTRTETPSDFDWTVPGRVREGDILFFYQTQSAGKNISKLIAEHQEAHMSSNKLIRFLKKSGYERTNRLLEEAADKSGNYSGKIFACARIAGRPEKDGGAFYAVLDEVHIFDHPLPADDFTKFAKVGEGNSRPLYGSKFDGIKQMLSERNPLPTFLQSARIGGLFQGADQDNWPSVSCAVEQEFENELQMRVYLLDFLLTEIKNDGTPLLEECRCSHKGRPKSKGFADYIVKIHGRWVPVETKLKITSASQRRVLNQTLQYVRASSFVPTQGVNRGKRFDETTSSTCLIVDQTGIYITSDGEFSGCSAGNPVWRRQDLSHDLVPKIRERIREDLDE